MASVIEELLTVLVFAFQSHITSVVGVVILKISSSPVGWLSGNDKTRNRRDSSKDESSESKNFGHGSKIIKSATKGCVKRKGRLELSLKESALLNE